MARARTGLRVWTRRIAWLAVIWAASVAALGAVAGLLRVAMHAAGLSE